MFSFASNKHVEFHRASAHLCLLFSPEYGSAQWVMGLCFCLVFLNSDITDGLSSALSPPHLILSHRKKPSCFVACGKRRFSLDYRTRFFSLAAQVGGRTFQRISLSLHADRKDCLFSSSHSRPDTQGAIRRRQWALFWLLLSAHFISHSAA